MINRILVDVDDVMNECTRYALQWLGIPFDYANFYRKYPSRYGYDIVTAANDILGYDRFTVPSFWSMIPREFWASAPKSVEADYLLAKCSEIVGQDNICLLTAPTKDPDCLAGKLEWIQRVMPPWLHRQYLVGPRKTFCAYEGSLLIDDSDANVEKFRAAGGKAILVPRPWNALHDFHTMTHLVTELELIQRQQCATS